MKKKRWVPSFNPKNPHPYTIKKMDRQMTVVLFTVIFIYMWVMLITYYIDNHQGKSYSMERRGLIFDLSRDSPRFNIKGFEFFETNPLKRRKQLDASQIWFLRPKKKGNILIKNIQNHLHRATQVSVLIKYYIGWPTGSKLSVSGTNYRKREVVTTEMSQYGQGYCTRILFLGHVQEVEIDASAFADGAFVIIDELLVGLGLYVFDGMDEETCS